jgi:hypothetical protein
MFSAEIKKYVKYSIYMHFVLSFLIIIQLIFHFGNKYLTDFTQFPNVPKPNLWEYIWLTSLIPGVAGYVSLKRNRLSLMEFYYKGTLSLGIGPILITMILNASDLLDYAQTKKTTNLYHNFPVIVLWYIYLFVVIQIHAFGVYFSKNLIKIWSREIKKKN